MIRGFFSGHRNVVLFVSHCGLTSTYEAAFHGVPVLGTPLFADQFHNSRLLEYLGQGVGVDPYTLTHHSEILTAVNKILDDPR